ncbi:MAG TPA: ABC transporter ATP-binding protein [Firmicutes bacterium]|jgi:peptide/nickel transport system ATP-binding protein|nr:ABC transporter ATP-binding protein [Bacillota bacterium]
MELKQNTVYIKDLFVRYRIFGGQVKVLNGVNLSVKKGEKVSIVGETGCGKTTTVKSILRILPRQASIPGGEILFNGSDVLKMNSGEINKLRSSGASMIFQDPTMSLNPVFTIGEQMEAVIRYSGQPGVEQKSVRHELAVKALEETSMPDPERILQSYPFHLSGGMRQRVSIAMSLATPRDLVIADEPTTNLDVTIQDQVLKILRERVEAKGSSLILITHSLGVARETSDRIYVMYAGNMVETAPTAELFRKQLHPYSRALMSCIPRLSGGGVAEGIPGRLPNYINPPKGCRFAPRCSEAMPRCHEEKPEYVDVGRQHQVACFLYGGEGEAI